MERDRERGRYSWLPIVPGRETGRGGGLRGHVGVEGCGGRRRKRKKRVGDLVRAFLFLLFDLTDCHTRSTPSPSLHWPIVESLCFQGNHFSTSPWRLPLPTPQSAAIIPVPQRHRESGLEREDVMPMEETERAKRREEGGRRERGEQRGRVDLGTAKNRGIRDEYRGGYGGV